MSSGADDDDDDVVFVGERKRRASEASNPRGKRPKRRNAAAAEGEREVREAPFISRPSSQVQDRIDRAFQHRLYLIDRRRREGANSCDFIVQGATGNVYTVKLRKRPSCTCPDFGRCYTCKHVLFVMLRVLKLPGNDPRVWQKALLSSEVEQLLSVSDASVEASVLASQRVRQEFRELETGGSSKKKKAEESEEKSPLQRPVEGDCPVCYEAMEAGGEAVVFCNTCGNNVHKECFKRWSESKASSSASVTCIYCRAVWQNQAKPASVVKRGGYVNLASFSEHHRPEAITLAALYPDSYHARNGYYGRYYGGNHYEEDNDDDDDDDDDVDDEDDDENDHCGVVQNEASNDPAGHQVDEQEEDELPDEEEDVDDGDEDYEIDGDGDDDEDEEEDELADEEEDVNDGDEDHEIDGDVDGDGDDDEEEDEDEDEEDED